MMVLTPLTNIAQTGVFHYRSEWLQEKGAADGGVEFGKAMSGISQSQPQKSKRAGLDSIKNKKHQASYSLLKIVIIFLPFGPIHHSYHRKRTFRVNGSLIP